MLARLGLSRPQFWLVLLLATVLVVMATLQERPETVMPYDPADTNSNGLRALVLWLEEMEYATTIGVPRQGIPDRAGLLLIHPSNVDDPNDFSEAEVASIHRWVESGGTLVLVGPRLDYSPLAIRFGVAQIPTPFGRISETRQVQPLLPDMPNVWDAFYTSYALDFSETRATVPLLAHADGAPVVALQFVGNGVVWHLTEDFAFTNLHLRDDRIAALLPAILRSVPAGATAVVSTHHLAAFNALNDAGNVRTLQAWLYTTPFGQATLLVMVATLVYLLLQGRRLGPVLPGPTATRPREAAEYVSALAGLQRRIRQPSVVADHHRQRLKHAVGRLAQTPADLPDGEWLAQLHRADALTPTVLNEVTELVAGYAKVGTTKSRATDETEVIRLVQATDALLASLPRANMQLVR